MITQYGQQGQRQSLYKPLPYNQALYCSFSEQLSTMELNIMRGQDLCKPGNEITRTNRKAANRINLPVFIVLKYHNFL